MPHATCEKPRMISAPRNANLRRLKDAMAAASLAKIYAESRISLSAAKRAWPQISECGHRVTGLQLSAHVFLTADLIQSYPGTCALLGSLKLSGKGGLAENHLFIWDQVIASTTR